MRTDNAGRRCAAPAGAEVGVCGNELAFTTAGTRSRYAARESRERRRDSAPDPCRALLRCGVRSGRSDHRKKRHKLERRRLTDVRSNQGCWRLENSADVPASNSRSIVSSDCSARVWDDWFRYGTASHVETVITLRAKPVQRKSLQYRGFQRWANCHFPYGSRSGNPPLELFDQLMQIAQLRPFPLQETFPFRLSFGSRRALEPFLVSVHSATVRGGLCALPSFWRHPSGPVAALEAFRVPIMTGWEMERVSRFFDLGDVVRLKGGR
jgi:hypothetical protein